MPQGGGRISAELTMLRTYPMQHAANWQKVEKVLDLFLAYPAAARQIASAQWRLFFESGRPNKNAPIKIASRLSARYRQTCQYQVVGMLDSFLSNRANDYKDAVLSMSEEALAKWDARHSDRQIVVEGRPASYTRMALLYLGKYRSWYQKTPTMKKSAIPGDILRLSRNIMRGILSRHRKPSMTHIQMHLDGKVATIEPSGDSCFPYWLKLSTLEAGKPILIPIRANPYYESIPGIRKPFVQVNLTPERLSFGFVKEITPPTYLPKMGVIGIDVGLRNLMATSEGDLMGRNLIDRLILLDKTITRLAVNRQKMGLRVRCARYDALTHRLREFLKNEMHRVINRLIEIRAPKEIAIEHLDFRSPELSRRMNRLVQNFGRRLFRDALNQKSEALGIIVTEVNAAYSSQTCGCGYVDKKNRHGERFECRHCRKKSHADINAGRNIRDRRSDPGTSSRYIKRSTILEVTVSRFLERNSSKRPHSRPGPSILSNPYFLGLAGCRTEPLLHRESRLPE
jgi:putative transposase